MRSADYLMTVTSPVIHDSELVKYKDKLRVWHQHWVKKSSTKIKLLSNLSDPKAFQPLISQLESLSDRVTHESYDLISTSNMSQLDCDQLFERISTDVFQQDTIILQLFEPVELQLPSHPCLNKISKIYQEFSRSKLHNISAMKSLDWKKNEVSAQELVTYLWTRRSSWHAYAPNYAEDITPDDSPISEYSKLSHRMMIRNKTHKLRLGIITKDSHIGVLNLDLLKLLHPFMWRYDTTLMNYLKDNIDFEKFLRSIVFSNYEDVLLGKEQSALLEKRYEQYLQNFRLAYVSSKEKDAMDRSISNDLNNTVSQIKKDYDVNEIIFFNLSFPWEKKSLRAFQTLGKGKPRDLTVPAIKFLFKKYGMSKNKEIEILKLLHDQGLIQN